MFIEFWCKICHVEPALLSLKSKAQLKKASKYEIFYDYKYINNANLLG